MTETELRLMAAAAKTGWQGPSGEGIEDAGGEWDSEGVVDEGEEKILADVAHGGLAEAAGAQDAAKIAARAG